MDAPFGKTKATLLLSIASTLTIFFVGGIEPAFSANQAIKSAPHQSQFLTGTVTQNELIDNLERFGIKCILQGGAQERLLVDQVRMGSSAYYAGISKGDVVTGLKKANADTFCLTIEREGKTYQSYLKALSGQIATSSLQAGAEKTVLTGKATEQAQDKLLKAVTEERPETPVEAKPEKKLVPYDVELIIDISGSMNEPDGAGNLSKFEWCHDQVRSLEGKLNPYHKNLTITTFNNSFETLENCTPEKVEDIYAGIRPRGGTDLVDPLETRLNAALRKYKASGHPVLIAIITDGEPNIPRDPHVVNDAIINITQCMSEPDEIVVTFLQIGDTFVGRDFCLELDNNLVNEGAKYDVVDTKTFAELKSEGLVNALVDAIVETKNSKLAGKGNKHSGLATRMRPSGAALTNASSHLEDLQKQRKEIERQLLGK